MHPTARETQLAICNVMKKEPLRNTVGSPKRPQRLSLQPTVPIACQ